MAVPGETSITGRVGSVNEKGFRLVGADGWLNYSKFAVGIVAPERGAEVVVTLDKAGFVRAVGPADPSAAPAPLRGANIGFADIVRGGSEAPSTKDRTITRLAVLKAAAEFGAARPNLRSGEVLAIAASWERWVLADPVVAPAELAPDELDAAF
jgi:hypothetical protein